MVLRGSVAFGDELLLQGHHHVAVLGVDGDEPTEFLGGLHHLDQLDIVDADGAAVRHERLERRDALFLDATPHPFGGLITPPGDGHVECVVSDGLRRLVVPRGESFHEILVARRDHEIDDGRRATRVARRGAGLEVIGPDGAHEGKFHVHVRIDATGEDVLPGRVDRRVGSAAVEVRADSCDLAVVAVDVADVLVESRDDRSVLD